MDLGGAGSTSLNETYHKTTQFTPVELHLNKKPKRAWQNWLNFPQNNSKINHERKLEMAKENISRKGRKRDSKFNKAHRSTSLKDGDNVLLRLLMNLILKKNSLEIFANL